MARAAIIVGGTGKVGNNLLRDLLRSDQIESVISVGRREIALDTFGDDQPMAEKKLTQRVVDFEKLDDFASAFEGADNGFCCLGTTKKAAGSAEAFRHIDYDYAVGAATLMKKGGVKRFSYCSSASASSSSMMLYLKVKGEVEDAVKALGFEHCSIFQPGMLLGRNDSSRMGEKIAAACTPSMFGVKIEVVARAMLRNGLSDSPLPLVSMGKIKQIAADK